MLEGLSSLEPLKRTVQPSASKTLTVVAPTRYPWRFNSPRKSQHRVVRRRFLPLNYVSPKLEGVTAFPPFPRPDLIHAFNRIPMTRRPFVIGFESHLPRGFGIENSAFFRWMTEQLLDERCRAIVAISDFARRMFLHQHANHPQLANLQRKLVVRLPSVQMPAAPDPEARAPLEPLRLLFVGNHFARKGGCVALRMAEQALAQGLPLHVEIISKIEIGPVSWTDPSDPAFFDRYRPSLSLPNVTVHGALSNEEVLERVRKAHFVLLPTFGDTFGYSAIEGLMHGTPVIATAQCALPEFITDGINGFLLDLPVTAQGEWILLGRPDRASANFAEAHAAEVDRLAATALERLSQLLDEPHRYAGIVTGAHESARQHFDAVDADVFWDDLYSKAAQGVVDFRLDACERCHAGR